SRGPVAPAASHPCEMEAGAGQSPASRERWRGKQAAAAATAAQRGRRGWGGRGGPAAATAIAQRRWDERVPGGSGVAFDRPGRATHAPRSYRSDAPRHAGGSEGLVSGIVPVLTAPLVMPGAEVTASVDRKHLRVGEDLMLA